MTLLESSIDLYRNGSEILAAFVLMFIIIAPAVLLCSLIWILGPLLLKGKRAHTRNLSSHYRIPHSP